MYNMSMCAYLCANTYTGLHVKRGQEILQPDFLR